MSNRFIAAIGALRGNEISQVVTPVIVLATSVEEVLVAVRSVPMALCKQLGLDRNKLGDYEIVTGENAAMYTVPVSRMILLDEAATLTAVDLLSDAEDPTINIIIRPAAHTVTLHDPRNNAVDATVDYAKYSATFYNQSANTTR